MSGNVNISLLDIVVDIFFIFCFCFWFFPSTRFGSIIPCRYDLETFPCQFYWYIQARSRGFSDEKGCVYVGIYKLTMRHGLVARCQNTDFNNLSYFINKKMGVRTTLFNPPSKRIIFVKKEFHCYTIVEVDFP